MIDNKSIECNICRLVFARKKSLKVHEDRTHKDNRVTCQDCGKQFNHIYYLNVHTKNIHKDIQKYKCNICESTYSSKGNLETHQKNKHEELKFLCKYCGMQFTQNGSLKLHTNNIHRGTKHKFSNKMHSFIFMMGFNVFIKISFI